MLKRNIFLQRQGLLRKFSADKIKLNINYFEEDKISHSEAYNNFLVDFLQALEPIKAMEGQIMQKEDREPSEIYFAGKAPIDVGYNRKKFILKKFSTFKKESKVTGSGLMENLLKENFSIKSRKN